MKAALYVRVSTLDQNTENQAIELRRYIEARGWTAVEYRDHGVSGAKDRRPALDGWWPMRSGGGSTCSWSGGWIDSGGTSGTWSR